MSSFENKEQTIHHTDSSVVLVLNRFLPLEADN